jgi:DNA-directed RNA polymerase subunit RPC12/RpoP
VSTDQLAEALRLAERQPSTTDYDTFERCPECLSPRLMIKPQNIRTSDDIKADYGCHECGAHFDEPRDPLAECPIERGWKWLLDQHARRTKHIDTMPINTPFEWLSSDDLTDPAERGGCRRRLGVVYRVSGRLWRLSRLRLLVYVYAYYNR